MTGIILRAPDLPEAATPRLVADLTGAGAFGLAFSGAVVLAGNTAVQALNALGVAESEWPDFEAAPPHERSAVAAAAAGAAVERRRHSLNAADLARAEAAVQTLEATARIHARTRYGVPEGSEALKDFFGELILLGSLIGQADLTLAGELKGALQALAKPRPPAQVQEEPPMVVVRWHAAVRAKALALCQADPSITSSQLAGRIDRDREAPMASYEQVLKFVRAERKAGIIPSRETR